MNKELKGKEHGFTVLELVVIIVIIGVIGFTLTPNTNTQVPIRVAYEARRVLNDIRYTQALSMASGQRYRWVLASSTSYQITNEAGTAITLPNGSTTLTLSSGVSFGSLTNLPSSLVAFDSQGVPYTNSSIPGTALGSTATIPVTSGGQTFSVSITPTTGYGAVS